MKEIRIYALNKGDFKDVSPEIDKFEVNTDKELKTINIGNTFFVKAYLEYKRIDNTDFINDIVKVFLPIKCAGQMLQNGIYIGEDHYIPYTSTPSLQKKEDGAHKAEFIFIKESEHKFINWFEGVISLKRFKEEYTNNTEPIAINKKITSRTALAFSDVTKINCYEPRIIIVDNFKYPHTAMVDMVETVGKGKDRKIVLDETGKPKLILNKEHCIEHEANDGMGLMSPLMAQVIRESMGLEYDVYFAVIRMFNGLAVKGLCLTFDYVSYFEEYNKNSTGKYGCYTVVDAYGKEQDIRQCDLLLTTSQCKWWENFKNCGGMEEVNRVLNSAKRQSVKDMLSALYVTKVNKNPEALPTHTLSNYQLIGNTSITLEQYKELANPTYKMIKGVIEGDMNYIKIFLKDFTKKTTYINEDGEEVVEEVEEVMPSTVTEKLLNISHDFYNLQRIKDALYTLVENKLYNLMSGRVLISGNYTYVAQDPILMLNRIIGIKTEGELEESQFYCMGKEKEYVIQRCPCNCFNEILTIQTTSNEVYDKYLSHTGRELLILNAKDSTNTRMSTMDFDGDGIIMSDEKILIDSVIKSDTFFVNQADGQVEKMVYNEENKLKALYETSGNLIGRLALIGGKVSNYACGEFEEVLPYLYSTLLAEQIAIDCPKAMIQVPQQMKDVTDKIRDNYLNPYYMKYRSYVKNQPIFNEENYVHINDCTSVLDRYAKYCVDTIIAPNKGKGKRNGETGSKTILEKMVIPPIELSDECKFDVNDIWVYHEKENTVIDKWYTETSEIKVLLDKKKELRNERDKTRVRIKNNSIELKICNDYDYECILDQQIIDDKQTLKRINKSMRKLDKQLQPYNEEKKAKEAELKSKMQQMSFDLFDKYSEHEIVKALMMGRADGKQYTPAFLLNNFADLITKYMLVENCYRLEEVQEEEFDFSFLDKKYRRVKCGLADSHFVAQSLLSNTRKAKKKGLGINSSKQSLGFFDTNWNNQNYEVLKGKTLKLEIKDNELVTIDESTGEIIGKLFRSAINIKGVDMTTVEEIKILDIEFPKKFTGKSIYIYFTM